MKGIIKNILLVGVFSTLLLSCEKDGKKQEFYYPEPTVLGIYPTSGYTLSQVAINGENFGDRLEPISVFFGDKEAEIISCKNNRIVVVVPKDAVSSEVMLKVWQYEFDNVGKFTVVSKPTITSVSSSNEESTLFAAEGDIVTISGISFGTEEENITVKIGNKTAEIVSVQDDEIRVKAPGGYGLGEVSLTIKGYETSGSCLLEPTYTGDLTAFALKNCSQPFTTTDDALDDVWGIPTDWLFNEKFYYTENGSRVLIRPLLIDGNNPDGCISFLCNFWSNTNHKDHPLENAKMYQVAVLPAGKYTIKWTVQECNTVGGNFGTIIGVTEGNATLPGFGASERLGSEDESKFVTDESGKKAYFLITDEIVLAKDGPKEYSMDMQLAETTQVTIGFVANISLSKGGNVNISKMVVERGN